MIINRSYRVNLYKPLNNFNVINNIQIIVHYVLFVCIFKNDYKSMKNRIINVVFFMAYGYI